MGTRTRTASAAVVFEDGDGGEQLPISPTLWAVLKDGVKFIRYAKVLPSGKERLRHPETGRALRMDGDVGAFTPKGDPMGPNVLRLWWRGAWIDVPSMAQFGEWTFDSSCETPEGDPCEPDAPESWLRLCGLV